MSNCPVCGKKISFMEGYGFYDQTICFDCHKMTDTDFLSSLSSQAIKQKIDGIDDKLKRPGIPERVRADLLHVREIFQEAFEEQALIEREKHEENEQIRGFHVSTLSTRPGYTIKKSFGVVFINPKTEGYEMNDYNAWMEDAINALSKKAYKMGANTILDLQILQQGSYLDSCLFYGTAAYTEPIKTEG